MIITPRTGIPVTAPEVTHDLFADYRIFFSRPAATVDEFYNFMRTPSPDRSVFISSLKESVVSTSDNSIIIELR